MSRVAMIFTGGTIASLPDAAAGGNMPVLKGADIIARTPELAGIAEVEPIDWGLTGASHMRFEQLISIARLAAEQLARPDIDGAVIVQGTDGIEETAFAWDLLLPGPKPVVVTGAMRDAASPDYDGPRNLADAVRCAASPLLRDAGTVVVLDGLVIPADDVVKSHSTAMDAFQPRDRQPLARVVDGEVVLVAPRAQRRLLPAIPEQPVEDVYLVTVVAGDHGTLVRCLPRGSTAGLVVAATGSGNSHPDLLAAAVELMESGTVVVLTTRCARGFVAPLYAAPGCGVQWQRAGAIMSALDGLKSRIALGLGIAAGLDRAGLEALIGQ